MKKALVITTISPVNTILKKYAEECFAHKIDLYIIGDSKTPTDFHLDHCNYYSIESQQKLEFESALKLPVNHYSRKNIGYLLAMAKGAEVIQETDDDNIPMYNFWKDEVMLTPAYHLIDKGWINIYSYFTEKKIWPRAFPLEYLRDSFPDLKLSKYELADCPIQQGLANDNPDVDAIFRLVKELPVHFKHGPPVALGNKSWCPFNSQNTRWFKPAFPLLYLPSYCSFRMTDIWRSFVAQVICHINNWSVLFHKPTVYQQRNDHNLIRDLQDEVPGYLNNNLIIESLSKLELKKGIEHINYNLKLCYSQLVQMQLIHQNELDLIEAWLADFERIYKKD